MRRFRRIVATAALGVAVSALLAAPAAASKHWADPDGTRVTSVDPDGWAPGGNPDGTRVTSEPQVFDHH